MSKKEKVLNLDEAFWTDRYINLETGWNVGSPSTPLVEYFDQLKDRNLRILIPGAGNAYEAEYLHQKGFKQVFVLDLSKAPLENLKLRCPDFPDKHLLHRDFFRHHLDDGATYDLIIEQTFFCALDPKLRPAYAEQMYRLLKPGGKLAGLWFSFPLNEGQENPPFGGSLKEYKKHLSRFNTRTFEPCHNSIEPRKGNEFFAIMQKPT